MSDDEFTIFCGNLAESVSEEILYELFLQAGPVEDVRIPSKEGRNQNYGFVTYKHKSSVNYAMSIFENVTLFDKPLKLQKRSNKNNANRHKGGKSNGENSYRGSYSSEIMREDLRSSMSSGRKHSRMYEEDMTASLRGSSSRHIDLSMLPTSRSVSHNDGIPSLSSVTHHDLYRRMHFNSRPFLPYSMFNPMVDPRNMSSGYSSSYTMSGTYRSGRDERSASSSVPSDDYRIVTTRNHSSRHKHEHHRSRSPHHKSHKSHRHRRN